LNPDGALVSVAKPLAIKSLRTDHAAPAASWRPPASWVLLSVIGLALGFVVLGAESLDLGPQEARLGLAAGEQPGPVGQVLGHWAPDLWPAQVWSSHMVAILEPGGRPTSGAVRWPSAIAGIIAGWILVRGTSAAIGLRAGILLGICWFGSLGLIDRSSTTGLDLIMGLGILAAIDRLIRQGSDRVAGLWASLAFLAGGWPPLVVIGLAIIVIGKKSAHFSIPLLLPPLITATCWSFWTLSSASPEVWAAALTLPLTRKPDWSLALGTLTIGLPWSPFVLLAFSRSVRESWKPDGRPWLFGWLQVRVACLIAGTIIPGLSQASRAVALAGLSVVVAASLESAWTRKLTGPTFKTFFIAFSGIAVVWLTVMIYGCYLWTLTAPFYRPLGVVMTLVSAGVAILAWSSLETGNTRRGLATLFVMAVGLKLAAWGYYVPEWNYRDSQGPWSRAFARWVPPKWTIYTFHDWTPDLMFFTKRAVRQLPGPRHLEYQPRPESKYVLLQASEFENWPEDAPPITVVARFQDQSCGERVLARTHGNLPLGYRSDSPKPNPPRQSVSQPGRSESEPVLTGLAP